MYRKQCVLALLVLYVGLAHSFSWDIVVSGREQLQFYNNNGALTHTEVIPSIDLILSIAYDPVHNRLLIGGSNEIFSFDIATRKIQSVIKSNLYGNIRIAYDPVTMLLFWIEQGNSLNSILLKPGSYNTVNINIFNLKNQPKDIKDIDVDSCGGYIYWTTDIKIERGRFDGSQRETVDNDNSYIQREAMVIDQQTQKIYWLEQQVPDGNKYYNTIESADLNGENRRTLYVERDTGNFKSLAVSKDSIYLGLGGTFWEISKNPPRDRNVKPKKFLSIPNITYDGMFVQGIASNYKIEDQTPEIQYCDAMQELSNYDSFNGATDVSLLCVHGTKVSGESRCECTQGYSGERCEVPVCHNYCFHGDCSVSAEGQPKCRCNTGYSGERCEVKACHNNYCSNNGFCSLNAESKPICQCTEHYEGKRCDVPVFLVKCLQTVSMLRDILSTDVTPVTLGRGVKATCAPTDV